jgi:hypothetical protein
MIDRRISFIRLRAQSNEAVETLSRILSYRTSHGNYGTFEHAVNHLLDHGIDLSSLGAQLPERLLVAKLV